jgi:signal peptidase I
MSSGPVQRSEPGDPSAAHSEVLPTPDDQVEAGTESAGKKPDPGNGSHKRRRGVLAFLQELPVLLVIAFILALLIKSFLMQAFYIPSESMEPTLNVGDRVLVNKVVYHLHAPRRGDIIVFADPNPQPQPHRNAVSAAWHWLTEGLGVATSPEKDFIKRVIGLPGDHLECRGGSVFINGTRLNEPYITVPDDRACGPYDVPANKLFVMGDNRLNSRDSRYGLGFVPYDKVIGRAFVIIWPPSHMGWLRGS